MKIRFFSLSILVLLVLCNSVFAQSNRKIIADKKNSSLEYEMSMPLHGWTATCKSFNAAIVFKDESKSVEQIAVVARSDSFDSGNGNRDSHAIEAVEALKHPTITFKSTAIIQQSQDKLVAEGFLTFHGITQKVVFNAKKKLDKQMIVEGGFVILMSDYLIERPSLLGVKADNEIKIKFKMSFNQ